MSAQNPEQAEVSGGSYARQTTSWVSARGNQTVTSPQHHGGFKLVPAPGMLHGTLAFWDGQAQSWVPMRFNPSGWTNAEEVPVPTADEAAALEARRKRSEARRAPQRPRPSVDLTQQAIEP